MPRRPAFVVSGLALVALVAAAQAKSDARVGEFLDGVLGTVKKLS